MPGRHKHYHPEKGDKFDVEVRRSTKIIREFGVMKCTGKSQHKTHAIDEDSNKRIFEHTVFIFILRKKSSKTSNCLLLL